MDYKQIWDMALSRIELELSRVNFNTWFRNTQIINYKEGVVIVGVPNDFVKEWLLQKHHKFILRILREIHNEVRGVEFHTVKLETLQKKAIQAKNKIIEPTSSLPLQDLYINKDDGLNQKYTFTNFVVGSFNELAFAASQAIIKSPGIVYNPLFIYGNTGLGKTHLIQAIGNTIKNTHPEKKVFYTSLEKYYLEFVSAINSQKLNNFKEKYKKYDIFIMDDIQFINGKEKTQDELFHLFNSLHNDNKQIVFSSDKHPNFIVGLEDRLKSRFSQGMIVDVGIPDYESRVNILKSKIKNHEKIEDGVIEYVAESVNGNIRELEGIINHIQAQIELFDQKVTLISIKNLIKNNVRTKKTVSISEVVKTVAEYYNIQPAFIYNKTRRKDIVKPRQVIMYILREYFDVSYPTIGEKLGGKDHTTVIHSYEKIKKERKDDPYLNKEIEEIHNILK
jgi:chromosomal replication initiator protein